MTAADSAPRIRRRVVYSGRVQGVFFRATTADLSRPYDVVGYVRNMPDGTVELAAEGPPQQVDAFLDAVARHFQRNIMHIQTDELPACGDESRFEIRY